MAELTRIPPFHYIHVLNNNLNTQRIEVGPLTFTKLGHEQIVLAPTKMINIPPRHYCIIKDPYIRKQKGSKEALTDKHGQVQIKHGDLEIRFHDEWKEPFPLLPGEKLKQAVTALQIVKVDSALRLLARRDFKDDGKDRVAGDEWLFEGPGTYYPRVEVDIREAIKAVVVQKDNGIKLQARRAFKDRKGVERKAGEEWILRETGAYLQHVDEVVLGIVRPISLSDKRALHFRATDTFTDTYGKKRKAGEEWLVAMKDAQFHLQGICEVYVGTIDLTVVNNRQYCVLLDPLGEDGKNQYGVRLLRKGPCTFFLNPGERLESGIQNVYVLGGNQSLLLKAIESFTDDRIPNEPVERKAGNWWMVQGPTEYVPPVQVEVQETREAIPLDKNEGIYVRQYSTGKVRVVTGQTYMLDADEELYQKDLPDEVEYLLVAQGFTDDAGYRIASRKPQRDKTRAVTFKVPHNSIVQIYDYKARTSRYVLGPRLVMLQPDEEFTVLSLSGGKPKRPNVIKTIAVRMGPDFMTDIIDVETSDHARLKLQVAYNWFFNFAEEDPQLHKVFQVRDFVGDACKVLASKIRGVVAATAFDTFHKHSAKIIRKAVFEDEEEFEFTDNCLCITNIDVQSVDPIDERTRESLMQSVQQAIQITTKKQERNARHDAAGLEQKAKGEIEQQKINNKKNAESDRKQYIQLKAECSAIEASGSARAEAKARAEAAAIKGELGVAQAKLNATASNIEAKAKLDETKARQDAELQHREALGNLELAKAKALSGIETSKFKMLVSAIGPRTIQAIARAGPEMQGKLLGGLGLKGYLMTDGNSPINLFNAARGMVGQE